MDWGKKIYAKDGTGTQKREMVMKKKQYFLGFLIQFYVIVTLFLVSQIMFKTEENVAHNTGFPGHKRTPIFFICGYSCMQELKRIFNGENSPSHAFEELDQANNELLRNHLNNGF